jgi:hypothetical protein
VRAQEVASLLTDPSVYPKMAVGLIFAVKLLKVARALGGLEINSFVCNAFVYCFHNAISRSYDEPLCTKISALKNNNGKKNLKLYH